MGNLSARITPVLARKRVALGFFAGVAMLVLAQPTWESWRAGLFIAAAGECLRLWAAGHLEKRREVTRSGPYRFLQHPLYVGSMVIALGVAVAARGAVPALVAGLYMGLTVAAAIHVEEAQLREAFGATYDDYRASRAEPMVRGFSLARALRNREHRACIGLILGFALLALKILVPL